MQPGITLNLKDWHGESEFKTLAYPLRRLSAVTMMSRITMHREERKIFSGEKFFVTLFFDLLIILAIEGLN
jgi:hypothetical protein